MDPDWLTGIGTLVLAIATVALAGVTVWSVRKNNEANSQLREENKRLNELERHRIGKMQSLEIIGNWADDVFRIIGGKMFSLQTSGALNSFLHNIGEVTIDMEAMDTASNMFESWFGTLLTNTVSHFDTFRKSVLALRDSYATSSETDKERLKEILINERLELLNATIRLKQQIRVYKVSLLI